MKWELDLWYELWDRAGSQGLDTWHDMGDAPGETGAPAGSVPGTSEAG